MYFQYQHVKESARAKDARIRNFFDTFGFCVIRNFYSKKEYKELIKEYDRLYKEQFKTTSVFQMLLNRLGFSGPKTCGFRDIWKRITDPPPKPGMKFFPNFVDSSEIFSNFFFSEKCLNVLRYFGGENFIYLGSDGSHFFNSSFPWHRDWFTALPLIKLNSYFVKWPYLGGRFLIIPGSNRTCDSYAQVLQQSMSWPMQNKKPGGLNENNFLPQISNPRDSFLCRVKRRFRLALDLREREIEVPHVALNVRRRDLLIFDHRSIHCVETNYPRISRRLLTILAAQNPCDFKENHYLFKRGYSKDELLREVIDLVVNERNHIGIPAYGDKIKSHHFSATRHFLEIDKIENGSKNRYNRGTVRLPDGTPMSSILDEKFYEAIGSNYRVQFSDGGDVSTDKNSQEFQYKDVHLGINARRIETRDVD